MAQEQEIMVRRAKPRDAGRIAAFVNRGRRGQAPVEEQAVIERFGSVGFLVAEREGEIAGLLGWQAENLVVRVTDFLVGPASERAAISQALLSEMEGAAQEIECEVALLLLPRPTPPALVEFYKAFGYVPQIVAGLSRAWREAAREVGLEDDEAVLMKQLRTSRVLRPL